MGLFKRAGCVVAVLALAGAQARAAEPAGTPDPAPHALRLDPSVRRGVLPNGLRYVVKEAPPGAGVSLRLGFDVGSYEEDEAERGAAHFVEHMAFNGTRNFAEDKLETVFAPLGVGFGSDHNAHTSLFQTTYELDLPDAGPQAVDAGFRWLRDVADGMLFEPGAVERERRVILAEREASNGVMNAVAERLRSFRGGILRSASRDPIGTVQSLQAMTPQRLRDFHQRWYRPENAVVVLVGSMPAAEAERRIAAAFAGWTASVPARPRASKAAAGLGRGIDAFVSVQPSAPNNLSICRVRPGETVRWDDAARRVRSGSRLWRTVLQQRLLALAAQADPPIFSAAVAEEDNKDGVAVCVSVTPLNGDWMRALDAAQEELRRFAESGPTDPELDGAIEGLRAGLSSAAGARRSSAVAAEILQSELLQAPLLASDEALYRFNLSVDGLTPEDIRATFARDWSGAGPLLSLVASQAVSPAALTAAWADHKAGPLLAQATDAPADDILETTASQVQSSGWPYPAPKPGKVEKREAFAEAGFVRLTFRNGVVVNYRQSAAEKGLAYVRADFGAGRRAVAGPDYYKGLLGALTFREGGLGKLSYESLRALNGGDVYLEMAINDAAFSLSGAASSGVLAGELHLMAAYMSDPAFGGSIDAKLPTAIDTLERVYRSTPSAMVGQAMEQGIAPDSPRILPSNSVLRAVSSDDFQRILRPALTGAPIELTVVGDVDEASVVRDVAGSFGALPRRAPLPTAAAPWTLRFPDGPRKPIRVSHSGSAGQAAAGVYWPLYVATYGRRREEIALKLAAETLELELLRRIREALGKTYAPTADTVMPDDLDQGYLYALVETTPADVDLVVQEVRSLAASMARGEITAEMLESARQPLLTTLDAVRPTNAWWVNALAGSARDPRRVDDQLGLRALVAGVSLEEVKAAAKAWLAQPPVVVIAEPSAPGASESERAAAR